jgi:CheY-like chemotaxis protein
MVGAPKRVLVCDDDPVILRLLQVNLELEGYEVIAGRNGEEAVSLAAENNPDLVILDIMMPRLDGYQACEQIKSNDSTKDIPVVFLSAKAQQSDIDKGKEYGVAAYLTRWPRRCARPKRMASSPPKSCRQSRSRGRAGASTATGPPTSRCRRRGEKAIHALSRKQ